MLEVEHKGDRLRPSQLRTRRKGGGGRMMTGQMMKNANKGEGKVVGEKQEKEARERQREEQSWCGSLWRLLRRN